MKIRFLFATINASVDLLWKTLTWLGFSGASVMACLADSLVRRLLEGRYIASLATKNPDGSTHMVAVWYWFDGVHIYIATSTHTPQGSKSAVYAQSLDFYDLLIEALLTRFPTTAE